MPPHGPGGRVGVMTMVGADGVLTFRLVGVGVLFVCRSGWVDPPDLQTVFTRAQAPQAP